jgi:sugar fermentation stimulation protein A
MKYKNIKKGVFVSRPNRFIANVIIDGKMETAHVKNTGRCKELLIEGVNVYCQWNENASRKTKWSLIGVEKGERLQIPCGRFVNTINYDFIN